MPDLRTQPGPHVFVDDLETPVLAVDDRHHLSKSLRLRDGDRFTVSDGAGSWRAVGFGEVLVDAGPVHRVPPPRYELGLGLALTKASKPEFAVQKATELGIDHIIVFPATHSVARWDALKRQKVLPRLRRVAREAAMQSRRVRLPTVEVAPDLASLTDRFNVVRADFGGIPVHAGHRFVVIGPEGGWSDDEVQLIPEAVDLGQTVLRAETAAVAASAFLARSRDQGG